VSESCEVGIVAVGPGDDAVGADEEGAAAQFIPCRSGDVPDQVLAAAGAPASCWPVVKSMATP
jgi:hypothetical protein